MEDPGIGCAVDLCRLNKLIGDPRNRLAEKENAESADKPGHNERPVCILPAEPYHHVILRDNSNSPWDHHSPHNNCKQQVPAPEAHLCKNEPQRSTGVYGNSSFDTGDEQRIGKQAEEIKLLLYPCIVAQCAGCGEKAAVHTDDIAVRGERGNKHPDERDDRNQRQYKQHGR